VVKNYLFPGYAALRMFWIIPRKIRKMKADIVVETAHFGPFNLPSKIKRVTVIHDLTPILFPGLHRFHSQLLQKIFLKKILKRASLIITNSKNTSKDVVDYSPQSEQKVKSIYLGRDTDIEYCADLEIIQPYTNGHPYFLFAGTIEPRKNLEMLLEAFELFKQISGGNDRLIIVGQRGWKSKTFFRKLRQHPFRDEIILTGYVERSVLSALYSHATAFVFPSIYEGFGLPVLEAMSCGTPCLLSNSSSLPEIGGNAAYYFDDQDATELASFMIKISSNEELRSTLSSNALKQSALFSWEKHAESFNDEMKKLIPS
jgi:glycosyltransferase involved in cell wall biosynthesis